MTITGATTRERSSAFKLLRTPRAIALELLNPPQISYDEFKTLPIEARKIVLSRNRLINTDTYNRTMGELVKSEKHGPANSRIASPLPPNESYTLQMRRSQFGYLVACGTEDLAQKFSLIRISKAELEFAKRYYQETNVRFFNEEMWRWVVDKNNGKLPFTMRGVRDGTIMIPGEPLLLVEGPGELIAHFEHEFHRLFYPTLVATRAHALTETIQDPSRFIEVGKRGAITEEQHLQALKAMSIGGRLFLTSNDTGVGLLRLKDIGTIGHRYVQRFKSQETSFRHAIEHLSAVTLLVDLVDTIEGIDLALKLKQEYRHANKPIFVRLDSGEILDQVMYFLEKTGPLGMTNPKLDKVIVEGIDSFEEIVQIEAAIIKRFGKKALERVVYGAGGLLISQNTSRSDASTGFKLSAYLDENGKLIPTMKSSNSRGKISYPGRPEVVIRHGKRVLAQVDEQTCFGDHNLSSKLYANGKCFVESDSEVSAQQRAQDGYKALRIKKNLPMLVNRLRAQASRQTSAMIKTCKENT